MIGKIETKTVQKCPMVAKGVEAFKIKSYGHVCKRPLFCDCDTCEKYKLYFMTSRLLNEEVDAHETFLMDKLEEITGTRPDDDSALCHDTGYNAQDNIIDKIKCEIDIMRKGRKIRKNTANKHKLDDYDVYLLKKKNASIHNKKCALYLGCHIAEKLLSFLFKRVEKLPYNHPKFDFICDKGYRVDVKSSCIHKGNKFDFGINNNKVADYFLLIAFDNRTDLTPLGIWLIRADVVIRNRKMNEFAGLGIQNKPDKLAILKRYEQTDKLNELLDCCADIKDGKQCKLKVD